MPKRWIPPTRPGEVRIAAGVEYLVQAMVGESRKVAEDVYEEAISTVPYDTGALERSHKIVSVTVDASGRLRDSKGRFAAKPTGYRVEAGGRSPGAGPSVVYYASAVHELHPTRAKWLERALKKHAGKAAAQIAAAGRRAAR